MFTKRGRFSGPFIFGAVFMPPVRLPALDSHAPIINRLCLKLALDKGVTSHRQPTQAISSTRRPAEVGRRGSSSTSEPEMANLLPEPDELAA
jgi:hypothetical protein